jgi:hypothetical protein
MSRSKKEKSLRLVVCTVCHCTVPSTELVDVYADPVCRTCDEESRESEEEQWERETQREIDRLWGYQ